jgi:hypothetical protein
MAEILAKLILEERFVSGPFHIVFGILKSPSFSWRTAKDAHMIPAGSRC